MTEAREDIQAGLVVQQLPRAGTKMKKGDKITLYVSSGPTVVSVSDLLGQSLEQAQNTLKNNNLKLGTVRGITSGATPGTVIK